MGENVSAKGGGDTASNPLVGVVVLNWNGAEDTLRCVRSVLESNYENFLLAVVDNGSEAQDRALLRAKTPPRAVRLFNEANLGYGGGNNVGIEWALAEGSEYVLLLNNDVIVDENLLRCLVLAMERYPEAGVAGPRIHYLQDPSRIYSAGGSLLAFLAQPVARGHRERYRGQRRETEEVDYVSGACMLLSRLVVEHVGLLRDYYFTQWEDIDYCFRARRAGFKVMYVGAGTAWHALSASFRRFGLEDKRIERGWRNRIWFVRSFFPPLASAMTLAVVLLLFLPLIILYLTSTGHANQVRPLARGLSRGLFNPPMRRATVVEDA